MLADLPKTCQHAGDPDLRLGGGQVQDRRRGPGRARGAKYPVIDIDGVRADLPNGWGLVRASNTQAVLVLRFEAETEADLAAIQDEIKGAVERAIQKLTQS